MSLLFILSHLAFSFYLFFLVAEIFIFSPCVACQYVAHCPSAMLCSPPLPSPPLPPLSTPRLVVKNLPHRSCCKLDRVVLFFVIRTHRCKNSCSFCILSFYTAEFLFLFSALASPHFRLYLLAIYPSRRKPLPALVSAFTARHQNPLRLGLSAGPVPSPPPHHHHHHHPPSVQSHSRTSTTAAQPPQRTSRFPFFASPLQWDCIGKRHRHGQK